LSRLRYPRDRFEVIVVDDGRPTPPGGRVRHDLPAGRRRGPRVLRPLGGAGPAAGLRPGGSHRPLSPANAAEVQAAAPALHSLPRGTGFPMSAAGGSGQPRLAAHSPDAAWARCVPPGPALLTQPAPVAHHRGSGASSATPFGMTEKAPLGDDREGRYYVDYPPVGAIVNVDKSRGARCAQARSPVVALVEDHAYPEPGWAGAFLPHTKGRGRRLVRWS
jgi:hypothetical protein